MVNFRKTRKETSKAPRIIRTNKHLLEVYKLEDIMTIVLERYGTATIRELLNPIQSTPFVHGFYPDSETTSHSESKSPELTSTWEERENKNSANGEEDGHIRGRSHAKA